MKLVYSFNIKKDQYFAERCKASNDLYNQALYIAKKELNENKIFFGMSKLDKVLKETKNLDGEVNYRKLKAQVSQQTLKLLENNWLAYFKANKNYKKNPSKYKGMPKPPNFRKSGDEFVLIYPNQSVKIKDNFIHFDKKFKIRIPDYKEKNFNNFNQVRVIPKNGFYQIEIVYESSIELNPNLNYNYYSSIDVGLDNLATMVSNSFPVIYSGKLLKSYNQFYNKRKAKLISIKDKSGIKNYTKQLRKLEQNRKQFLKDYFHKVSRSIVNFCLENNIGNLVIGRNKSMKDSLNLGKKTNQKFVAIPHSQLYDFLNYKCSLVGINYIETEESYTSKCDSLSLEKIKKQDDYSGKRIKRGLFKSSTNKIFNADVNGALNILRKVVGDSQYVIEIINSGYLYNPFKIRNLFSNS